MARQSKEVNIRLIAEEAGVSVASVSRVLNNRSDVSEAVRREVLAVAEKYRFTPERSQLRSCRIHVILGVGDITDYISNILTGMELEASRCHVELTFQRCPAGRPLLPAIRSVKAQGAAVISGSEILPEVSRLAAAGLPCMLINDRLDSPVTGYIYSDDSPVGMTLLLKHIESLGHRKIGYLSAGPDCENYRARLAAYRAFMTDAGESPDAYLIAPYPVEHIEGIGRDKRAGYQQTMQLLARAPEVTAIICANDELALGCYKACADNGLRIPQDISVVGYDDQSFAQYLTPGLTTLRMPLAYMGRRAIRALNDLIRGRTETLPGERLTPELIIRGSVAPPSAR